MTLEKIAILVSPKLSSELELRSTFLGQFWRYSDGIFSKVTRRTVAFSPKMLILLRPYWCSCLQLPSIVGPQLDVLLPVHEPGALLLVHLGLWGDLNWGQI